MNHYKFGLVGRYDEKFGSSPDMLLWGWIVSPQKTC